MALQNALGNIALDASVQQVLTAITAAAVTQATEASLALIEAHLAHQNRMSPPRALQYARDNQDQMRVSMAVAPPAAASTLTTGNVGITWANQGSHVAYYGMGAPTSMDAREQHKELAQQTFISQRARWTF